MIVQWFVVGFILIFGFVVFRGAPYVPSQKKYVRQALTELYPLTDKDTLLDFGSGDGVVLRVAARLGAHAVGYELNPVLVFISKILSRGDKEVTITLGDFWLSTFPEKTTVVYAFTVSRDVKKFVKKIQVETNRLNRPLHVVLYGNEIKSMKPTAFLAAYKLYTFNPTSL